MTILTSTILGLVIINIYLIFRHRERKRKYGLYPTYLLLVLFLIYILYYIFPYKMALDQTDMAYQTNMKTSNNVKYFDIHTSSVMDTERIKAAEIQKHTNILDILIHTCSVQSVLALLLSVWGYINIRGRDSYYIKIMLLSVLIGVLTYFIDISDHFTRSF